MTDFNPLAGALLGSAQVHHELDVQKQRQVRRAQVLRKNTAAPTDRFEHEVEGSEETTPMGEDPDQKSRDNRDPKRGKSDSEQSDERPHIDLKA